MKKMILVATLALVAVPAFSQDQAKLVSSLTATRQSPSPQLLAGTGFWGYCNSPGSRRGRLANHNNRPEPKAEPHHVLDSVLRG